MNPFTLVVTDTSPLITLAKADELDLLLKFGAPVEIPDIVFLEATRDGFEDGQRLAAWVNENREQVHIAWTSRVREWLILKEAGERAKGYGEIAAIEVVNGFTAQHPDEPVVLIYEDSDMNTFSVRAKVEMITTGTLLDSLEQARVIQSADRILDQATDAGRNVEKQRDQPSNERVADALRVARERSLDRGRGGFER